MADARRQWRRARRQRAWAWLALPRMHAHARGERRRERRECSARRPPAAPLRAGCNSPCARVAPPPPASRASPPQRDQQYAGCSTGSYPHAEYAASATDEVGARDYIGCAPRTTTPAVSAS
eukprot:scaffold104_cov375-Prasinococcus_capsulatus_cf.AAC.20